MTDDAFRAEYDAVLARGGVSRRDDRGLLDVTGADRADWLNNLVTNVVKTLTPGEGNYAFCVGVKGRVIFDVNMLIRDDAIWLDIDRRWIEPAMKWLDRYQVTEDVKIVDRTPKQDRIAVIGPAAAPTCEALGFGNFIPMAWLQHGEREIDGATVTMMRHDFTGLIGAEFIVVGPDRAAAIRRIESAATAAGAATTGQPTIDALRIEAGIPASVADIDEQVVPPETGQTERGISHQKGCYLGQEVIERMRSRGAMARKLVGIQLDGETLPTRNAPVSRDGKEVGRITSACTSPALGSPLALGYVKAAHAGAGTSVVVRVGDTETTAAIVSLPARAE